ncbi:hypothetical protein MGYG_06387 [Nannizzia gypsea CBS 118893]|uniref:Chromosome transmission fidelity protein 4 n=1 Tax=Arthroderma gypseum (strain ATCC MYA-4604 / CBS 118893) TaxID=535722 RepID=E4UZ58_ARTGP|nr:hypothetical protein MGYG_06387 [Nannizzia gypsea CBS 118893]EFR03388.1 hypothetical protein MGYG_06387 [Nannizzia gypsea CBS 118893]
MAKHLSHQITFPPSLKPNPGQLNRCITRVSSQAGSLAQIAQRSSRRNHEPFSHNRSLAQLSPIQPDGPWLTALSSTHFSHSNLAAQYGEPRRNGDHKPPDERIVRLGKTLRILSKQLPTILVNALPQEILSPSISLHLFPSTHPHLPTVKGRVPYRAALWTAPVAWGSVPIIGNVNLRIVSERVVPTGVANENGLNDSPGGEKLVVRWVTEGADRPASKVGRGSEVDDYITPERVHRGQESNKDSRLASSSASNGTNRGLSVLLGGEMPIFKLGKEEQFTGLFIFTFDEEGRIATHTIEHADEGNGLDRTAKVVTLADWLLGKAKGSASSQIVPPQPAFAAGKARETSRPRYRFGPFEI